jgi:hypothetical protein
MKDGLYRVEYKNLTAGFVISAGQLSACADILRRRFSFWKTIAKWVCP